MTWTRFDDNSGAFLNVGEWELCIWPVSAERRAPGRKSCLWRGPFRCDVCRLRGDDVLTRVADKRTYATAELARRAAYRLWRRVM